MSNKKDTMIETANKIQDIKKRHTRSFYIVDKNCYQFNKEEMNFLNGENIFFVTSTEKNKSFKTYKKIINELLKKQYTKKDMLVGVGGGIVCDLTTFVAGTFKRCIEHTLIPTTLLAMIDASVGGKGGINLHSFKNQVGVIKQPDEIIICTDFLNTLPEAEYKSAYGEIIKYAFISKGIYSLIKEGFKVDSDFISKCIDLKLSFVTEDPNENGKRKILNLGHTIGHALEAMSRGKISHGLAVAFGIRYIIERKYKLGLFSKEQRDKYNEVFEFFDIGTMQIDNNKLKKYILKDKKMIGDQKLEFIDIDEVGDCRVKKISVEDFLCL